MNVLYDKGDDHRIGRGRNGTLYIWDRSGDTPLDTDDGPLILDEEIVVIGSDNWRTQLTVPVLHAEGRRNVRISAPVAEYLVDGLGFTFEFGAHRFSCDCGHFVTHVVGAEIDCPVCDLGVEEAYLTGKIDEDDVRAFGKDPAMIDGGF